MVEGIDSSKSVLNQKANDLKEVNDRENEDAHTPYSKVVGKRYIEKCVS